MKDIPDVPKVKIKEILPPSSKSPRSGSGSSGKIMNQIKKIKKEQKVMKKNDFYAKREKELSVKTSTYEVKESPPSPVKNDDNDLRNLSTSNVKGDKQIATWDFKEDLSYFDQHIYNNM